MIQAIQVLRFHLLELEKVNIIDLYIFLDLSDLHDAACTNSMYFNLSDIKPASIFNIQCSAVVISRHLKNKPESFRFFIFIIYAFLFIQLFMQLK